MRLICLSLGIKMTCTLYEHEPELVAVPNARHAQSKSLMDEAGVFFTNSLEFLCYTDLNVNNLLWGESLKLNMRGDKMTGKKIDRDDVAGTLGIANESLDAGLLYYGQSPFVLYLFQNLKFFFARKRDALFLGLQRHRQIENSPGA
jgi:hypothetical protein